VTEVAKTESAKDQMTKPNDGKNTSTEKPKKDTSVPAFKIETPKLETMIIPVFGTICTDFSDDKLVYSKTLEQWTTHIGLDIKAEEGSPIRAAMDGTISEVKNDPQWGMTIVINHGGNVFTKYCNLSTLDMVKIGNKVKKGDIISGLGKTALYEASDVPHLHFEIVKNEKNIDPKTYLPKQSIKR
jgi:murein DD-endopeptidase MepM/ murein hydrolase activator NlpD